MLNNAYVTVRSVWHNCDRVY